MARAVFVFFGAIFGRKLCANGGGVEVGIRWMKLRWSCLHACEISASWHLGKLVLPIKLRFGLYANDSVLFLKSNWRRTGSDVTSWTVPLDGELRSLSDELSAGAVGRSSRRAGQIEASSDPLVRRDLGFGRLTDTEGWP